MVVDSVADFFFWLFSLLLLPCSNIIDEGIHVKTFESFSLKHFLGPSSVLDVHFHFGK